MSGRSPAPRAWYLLAGAIGSEVAGSLSLRGALDRPGLYVVVVAGFLTAFALLSLSLRAGMRLGVGYGIWGACGVALTAALSTLLFEEPLTPLMIAGILVVIAGVLCIELGSQAAARSSGPSGPAEPGGTGAGATGSGEGR
ncbi:QacE family quaternary ammonium compound efflux SMR transporter [Pseudactinotalea sp. HY160]|uniref:DMT family transporter n=1 Tax=Pseudactinotalea sp. HY160 TaxID=2654490 RepID=UPI00128DF661|nr:SMR family transporter [Pseudactinotalea sp. HY160]MPV48493.1 QacE family quaternary ammonium compound efflux SMR transporter [Pseudactinotalea sp. HY160]